MSGIYKNMQDRLNERSSRMSSCHRRIDEVVQKINDFDPEVHPVEYIDKLWEEVDELERELVQIGEDIKLDSHFLEVEDFLENGPGGVDP